MGTSQRRLYYESDALEGTAAVLRCFTHDGKSIAVLNTPLFHPQGGGQPADTGWLDDTPVVDAKVVDDEVWLWLTKSINTGEIVQRIDAQRRHRHSILHSAGHLLGNAGQILGLAPVKAHHWPDECKVVFRGTSELGIDAEIIQTTIDKLLAASIERTVVTRGGVREVRFGTLPAFPCGGTHVASTKEIANVKILAVNYKNGEYSVSYAAEPSAA